MRRLYFTLPRKPFGPVQRKKSSKEILQRPCTFDELADLIDPEPDTSTVWKKAVDRNKKTLLFYQLDLGDELPKFAKCVFIKAEKFRLKNHLENRLVPSVFLDENLAPTEDEDVEMALPVSPHICNVMDVVKLLQYVELFPEVPDDEDTVCSAEEAADAEFDKIVVSSSLHRTTSTLTGSSCEDLTLQAEAAVGSTVTTDEDNGDADDHMDCDSEYAPSAASENEELVSNGKMKSGATKPKAAYALNDSQIAYAKVVQQSLRKPGPEKEEIYPGAGIYAPSKLLQKIHKRYFHNITKNGEVRAPVSSRLPGVHLAITPMNSLGKFTDKLPTDRKSIVQIFDSDYLTEIAKFVNLRHEDVLSGRRLPLCPEQMIRTIQARMIYSRQKNQMMESDYLRKKRLNLLTPPRNKRDVRQTALSDNEPDGTTSLISSAINVQWNPRLPYNHPDFVPSYLFPRPGYVQFWPSGDNPPVYMKKQDLEYFSGEQSHTDCPERSRWIRALMYKILDEQALLHMCYIHSKKEQQQRDAKLPFKISLHSLLSTGFVRMLDEFMGRLTEDMDFLMRTLGYWFRDYRRTIVKRKLLTDDPNSVKVNLGKVVGRKCGGRRKR